jgi:hypothetical protein
VGSLAFLPLDTVAMTIVPLTVAGIGMGMALPALAGGLLPERTAADAARLLALRHGGITLAIAILAPVTAATLDRAADQTRERGTALILDAKLPPLDKLALARAAADDLDAVAPRSALRESLSRAGDGRHRHEELRHRADETLVMAINDAFAPAFVICGALGLLAAGGLLITARPRLRGAALACCATAGLLVPAQAALAATAQPGAVTIADPCENRPLPRTGGLDGVLQDRVLALLDDAACRYGSSREELALALMSPEHARAYADRHGIDPRSPDDLLSMLSGADRFLWQLLQRLL